jgi:hypothetical protein
MWTSHNFFGPGKSDYTQRPIDNDDRIEMKHDLLYEKAKSFNDIHKADSMAIREFSYDLMTRGNWHSLVSAVGIGVKYGFEGSIRKDGQPFNEGNFRWGYKAYYTSKRKQHTKATRAKKQRFEEDLEKPRASQDVSPFSSFLQSQEVTYNNTMSSDVVTGQIGAPPSTHARRDVSEGGNMGSVPSATSGDNNTDIQYITAAKSGIAKIAFEHVYLINTWGNAYKVATPGSTLKTKVTSLASVPVSAVCFWMTYAEFKNLPDGTRIHSVECLITPKGFKTSFDTGTSITASPNNTQGIFGQCAVGLNNKLMVRNYEISRNATQPVLISNFSVPRTHDVAERLWGHNTYDDNYDSAIPSCMGIPRALKLYAGILQPYKDSD